MALDEEERKRRYERARQLSNSINPSKTSSNTTGGLNSNFNTIVLYNYQGNTDEEREYVSRFQRARQLSNSINPRQNVPAPSSTDEEIEQGHKNVQGLLSLMDKNTQQDINSNNIQQEESNPNANSRFRINNTKSKEEVDKQIQQASSQNVQPNTNNENNNSIVDNDIKIGLASEQETQNAQELTQTDIEAMSEANRKNENIEKGGLAKFEEIVDTFFDNIIGGVKQTVSGLANVVTTGAALGLRGLEGAAGILGLEDASKSLNKAYNSTVEAGSNVNEIANYERTVNSQVEDDLTKTVGDVTNVISNMVSSQVIGYALPSNVPGVVIQGLSVGGNSAQEVLDENKDNIGQATLTGLAKGYTSYLTEKMFDANILTRGMKKEKKSIQNAVDKLISDKINSQFGKEAANRVVGILGENAEELVEDNIDNIIDNIINKKDTPEAFSEEWWANTSETAKITTISTIVMSLLGLGGESFHEKEVDMEANYWIDQAQQIIEQEDMAIHFNPSEVKTIDDTKDFYITRFTPEGEIANVVATRGKTIANPNQDLNVKPAIVRDNITNLYNVIDEDTGVVLDSTPYATTMEAESGFDEKVNKLSDIQIKDINQKIDKASYTVTNQFARIIDEARNELAQMTPVDYGVNTRQNTQQNQEQERKVQNFENINKTVNQISDKSVYNQTAVDNLLTTVSNNIDNIEYVPEDNGGGILYSFDNDRNITNQQEIKGNVYSGKKIKNIVNTAIQNADTTSIYQEANTDNTQTSSEQNTNVSNSNSTNYAVQDIKKVTEPFNRQESYSRDELAETWNDEISGNNYDAYYDSNGNIERYIAIEEDGNNIVANQYDNNDNVVKSEVIPSENGRYKASDIQDTLNRVASLYDENRPIKGQQDIEGNEVKSMKKNKSKKGTSATVTNATNDIASTNNSIQNKKSNTIDNLMQNIILKEQKNFKSSIKINTKIVDQASTIPLNYKKAGQSTLSNLAKKLFSNLHKRVLNNKSEKIYVTNSDINESIAQTLKNPNQRAILKDNIAVFSQLDKIIEKAKEIKSSDTEIVDNKARTQYKDYKYYYTQAYIDGEKAWVQFDTRVQKGTTGKDERHFRLERIYKINEAGSNGGTDTKSIIRFSNEPTSTNSISQNNQNVKDDGVRTMKNTFTKVTDSQGRTLTKQQQEYFKDSKVRDENGNLLVMYHGTDRAFTEFKNKYIQHGRAVTDGFYLTPDRTNASEYGNNIMELYANIKNPLYLHNYNGVTRELIDRGYANDTDGLIKKYNLETDNSGVVPTAKALTKLVKKLGYDGIITTTNENDIIDTDWSATQIVVFNSNQIKNITNSSPTSDKDIRYMKRNTLRSKTSQNNITVDNQGRTLSKQQQEYFKNSKVRDDNGNLQTVYHTTTNAGEQFNVFDPRNTDFYRFGNQIVNYYTDSKAMSGSYADGSYEMAETSKNVRNTKRAKRQYEGYINITNPYIVDAEGNNWNQVKTDINEYGKKLLNEIDVLEKNNIYDKLKQIYDDVERTSREASDRFYKIQKKAGLEQYDILGEYARWGNIDNIYENGLFNEQGKAAIANHINDTIDGKTLKEIGLDLFNNKYETLLSKEIDKLKKQYPDIKDIPLEDFDIIAEHYDEGKAYIENRYRNQETTNDIVKKVIDLNNNGANYDGVIIKNVRDYGGGEVENYNPANVYVTFNSNQFKNTNNTNPTSNQDIRFAKKTAKTPKVEGEILEPGQTNAQRESNYIEQEIRKIEQSGNWDDSIPVTRMTDIRKTIENYLGLGVQKGHFRQQAYGIYKGNRDVIRTKELKDMDTILHETGHALDIGKRIKIDKESISNELLTAVKKYGGYEAETRQVKLEEGFAEVIREYAIVPEQARIDYPQTVAVLEGIRQTDKDFNNFITTVQQQTYNYIHQNPVNRGGLSNMSIGERTDKPVLTPEYVKQVIIEKAWDSNYTIKRATQVLKEVSGNKELRASDNAYLLTRLVSGIGDKVSSMLTNGYIDENGNRLFPGLNQVGEILNNDETKFNNLRAYLVARRHMDYIAKDLKTGIRTNDAKAIIEQFENDPQIQEAAKVIYDTLDGVLQYAVNNKLITEENAEALRESNAFYVPFQRVIGNNGNNVGRKGAVADIIKGRTGSELDIKDVLENIITNSANIIQQVENNKIINALYTQGENAGLTGAVYDEIDPPMKKVGVARLDMWEKELENQGIDIGKIDFDKTIDIFVPNNNIDERNQIVSFIDNMGQRRYLQFHDQMLFKTLTGLDRESSQWFLNLCNNLNKPLRYGATLANLGFALPNMLSDTVQATIYSEAGFIPFIDTAIGAIDVLTGQSKMFRNFMNKVAPEYAQRVNTMYELYRQTGSTSATKIGQERKSAQKIMKDIYGTKNSKVLGINDRMAPLKRLLDIMTYIPELSEQSTRFRVFEKNLEYYRRNGMSEIDARMEAAIQARDATQDFSRMGTAMREVNKIIPFSAARVGSAYTFAEKMKANPKRTTARIALMLALNMALKSLTSDDDEINELNQRKKDDNFVFKVGDQVITIKKPQGFLRSLINLNDYIMDLANGNIDEGKEGERLKEWLFNAIMDNSVADDITGMVPSAITPVLENAINKDLYYNSDIVKSYDLELPDSEQYYDYNSQLAIWLGGIFNYSPAKIDNFISGYFAGLGTQVTNIIDWIVGKTGATPEEPNMGLEANSVGKRFFVNVNSNSQSVDDVYTLKTDLTKKANGGTITEEEEKQLEALTEATSNMAKLNKQIKEIKKSLTLSADEKADQIRVLQQQKTDTARQALGKDLLYSNNEEVIESTQFYPSRDTLSQNKRTLTLTAEMKKEYEEKAYEYYQKYEKQGLYSEEKLEKIKEKAKDYAKSYIMNKYKSKLVKSEND